jgi:cation transport ATPase
VEEKKQQSVLSKQERVAKQQELLEKKRQARAEYNVSERKSELPGAERIHELAEKKQQRQAKKTKEKEKKVRRKFQKSYQSAVAFDDADGVSVSQWFLSVCWMKIPVIGFIYLLVMAFYPKTHPAKKNFARGYLVYRVLVLLLAVTILYVLYKIGLNFVDQLLSLVE